MKQHQTIIVYHIYFSILIPQHPVPLASECRKSALASRTAALSCDIPEDRPFSQETLLFLCRKVQTMSRTKLGSPNLAGFLYFFARTSLYYSLLSILGILLLYCPKPVHRRLVTHYVTAWNVRTLWLLWLLLLHVLRSFCVVVSNGCKVACRLK